MLNKDNPTPIFQPISSGQLDIHIGILALYPRSKPGYEWRTPEEVFPLMHIGPYWQTDLIVRPKELAALSLMTCLFRALPKSVYNEIKQRASDYNRNELPADVHCQRIFFIREVEI